jgi:hypothetical protein
LAAAQNDGRVLRLRSALREFFPAALEAFDDLTS